MKKLWLTYSWKDDSDDILFYAQKLNSLGIQVKLDKWTLTAGRPLWDQIASAICEPANTDAWCIFATPNSLGSEPCREEYRYALDRALSTRQGGFPVIALYSGTFDKELFPAGLRTRLCVPLSDPQWAERVVAGVEGRSPEIVREDVAPFAYVIHHLNGPDDESMAYKWAIELRPRAGTWTPAFVGILTSEIPRTKWMPLDIVATVAPKGSPPRGSVDTSGGAYAQGKFTCFRLNKEATSTMSLYALFKEKPSKIAFGPADGSGYLLTL